MSNLIKSYEISVWEDKLVDGQLTEVRLGVIGSDQMLTEGRALEPNLIRNANGTKSFSFKMYKQYIDTITGEKIVNLFSDWLIAERKVKLFYEDQWYDFVIKDIVETSTDYLYRYTLTDALVQELAKNGFGVTFDSQLMNNTGDAEELARETLAETDWDVDSEIFVQTVDEALVYLTMPNDATFDKLDIYHIKDQVAPYNRGVTTELLTGSSKSTLKGKTILAFYSCCQNRPHRFQFIYYDNGDLADSNTYGKNVDGSFKINRKDDRSINQANCQYYIDFSDPTNDYVSPAASTTAKSLNLVLPLGFGDGSTGIRYNDLGQIIERDSMLSSWYRGKRYGYAQQAAYIPLLERYCQKFTKQNQTKLDNSNFKVYVDGYIIEQTADGETLQLPTVAITNSTVQNDTIVGFKGYTGSHWDGYYIDTNYDSTYPYIVSYKLKVLDGVLKTIGGHNASFDTLMTIKKDGQIYTTTSSLYTFDTPIQPNQTIEVEAKYTKFINTDDYTPYIFIQPNRSIEDYVEFQITELKFKQAEDYYGYTDSQFVSPTLLQNCITNYTFETNSGWTATSSEAISSADKPKVESAYGRFADNKFITISEDFLNSSYSEANTYTPYLQITTKKNNQFVLNSGIRDNRATIKNMPVNEEWVLDWVIKDAKGQEYNNFDFELGEYLYNISSGGYAPRTGFIAFQKQTVASTRMIFTVTSSSFNEETFKKDSKIYLKIIPDKAGTYYIEKIALYRKVVDSTGQIMVPGSDEESAETFANTGVLENKYHYFSSWLVDKDNPNAIIDKTNLVTDIRNSLSYDEYLPVYNEGAKKVRSITVKESNYFNILQTIAETFEAWLDLEITRNSDGGITKKTAKFKNYLGQENYANFRYGVNLRDIQRTTSSKNIVTKLIVKQNTNELGKDGFCTIARAGANPTGENYIYDFQYYHNQGIMDAEDFLDTVYYLEGATGKDAELWEDNEVSNSDNFTLKGYYPRLKKINSALEPINEELIGLNKDLIEKKAQFEVHDATYQAALSNIEQTREDFYALTGVYPEHTQRNDIESFELATKAIDGVDAIVPKEDWWEVGEVSCNQEDNTVSVEVKVTRDAEDQGMIKVTAEEGAKMIAQTGSSYKFKAHAGLQPSVVGLRVTKPDWERSIPGQPNQGRTYVLTYEIECVDGSFANIGCYKWDFYYPNFDPSRYFNITVRDKKGNLIERKSPVKDDSIFEPKEWFKRNERYYVTVVGTINPESTKPNPSFWIQPNRGRTQIMVTCVVSNIRLYKEYTEAESTYSADKKAKFQLNIKAKVLENDTPVLRTIDMEAVIPAGNVSYTATQKITAVDLERSDVQKYIKEYILYYEKREESKDKREALETTIAEKESVIKQKEAKRKQLLEYKKKLNNLFFKKYSRFIQEGTWINEEYVDDEKYYADSQSVLYNSCYPQVGYQINTIALSALPGYEYFIFELGDKTNVIDEEFFGTDKQIEVVITEISKMLDDPSRDTIKVQNFKNQFQDLFQKITATVQQTQYNSGSYEKGNAFLEANVAKQNEFITNAINDAQTLLSVGSTVDISKTEGITITSLTDKLNKLRLVGGAILFSTTDPETQDEIWRTGLTNDGISASLITAGRLDTGAIQIMSGDDPVFRWDAYGISAYNAIWNDINGVSTIDSIDSKKFVRFDKYGVYGMNNAPDIDGATWHPSGLNEIKSNATFALTWDGLFLKLGNAYYTNPLDKTKQIWHTSSATIGKANDTIFNGWEDGGPVYKDEYQQNPTFVPIIRAGDKDGDKFIVYDNGTVVCRDLYVEKAIQFSINAIPSRRIYSTIELALPKNNTKYGDIAKEDDFDNPIWHREFAEADQYYAQTDDAGATWYGPFLLNGGKGDKGDPGDPGPQGPQGEDAITCYVESLSGDFFLETTTGNITFTARIFSGSKEVDANGTELTYNWYINETLQDGSDSTLNLSGKTIQLSFDNIKNKSIYFEAS